MHIITLVTSTVLINFTSELLFNSHAIEMQKQKLKEN